MPSYRPGLLSTAILLALAAVRPAAAQIVADPAAPGNQQPTILQAPNGVPLVNIQTPSAAGVSRNEYRQFDVQEQGAILNNSRREAQTQLGGWVQGNPWLARGEARVILNEVNSSDPSHLRGYVEVAGQRAEVVIANPAGVQIDGGGFINASRATITTGQPILQGGSLEGYRVQRGTIAIEGKGLDASSTDYTGLLARAVEVNAGVWANDLQVVAGASEVAAAGAAGDTVRPGQGDPATVPVSGYALDVAALGGMYAGKIALVGTEAGLGVRNAGRIAASAGQVAISADGKLYNQGQILASGGEHADIVVRTAGEARNAGTLYAQGDAVIQASSDIVQDAQAVLAARGDVRVQARGEGSRIVAAQTSALAAGMEVDGRLAVQGRGNLSLEADGAVQAQGQMLAQASLSVQGSEIDMRGSQSGARDIALQARAGDIDLSQAETIARDGAALQAADAVMTAQGQLGANHITVQAQDLDNAGGRIVQREARTLHLDLPGTLDNRDGQIVTAGDLDIRLGGDLDNRAGSLYAQGDSYIDSGRRLRNSGVIAAQGDLALAAETLESSAGSLLAAGVDSTGRFVDGARTLRAEARQTAQAQGQTAASGDVMLAGASVDVRGGQLSGTALEIVAETGDIDAREASLSARDRLALRTQQAQRLDHRGGQMRARDIEVDTGTLDNQSGRIAGIDSIRITAGQIDNREGVVAAGQAMTLTASGIDNRRGALQADEARLVVAQRLDNQEGLVSADRELNLHDRDAADAQQRALAVDNRAGALLAGERLDIAAARLSGDGQVLSSGDLAVDLGQDYQHEAQGQLQANGTTALTSAGRIVNRGELAAGDSLTLRAREIDNTAQGRLLADKTTLYVRDRLDNRGLIDGTHTRIDAGHLNNTGTGRIYGDEVSIRTDRLDNTAETVDGATTSAVIAARERLDIAAGTLSNTGHALVFSAGDMAVGGMLDAQYRATGLAGRIDNVGATIEALGNLRLGAAALENANADFRTTLEQVADPESLLYIQPRGSTLKILAENLRWEGWSRAGQYRFKTDPPDNDSGVLGLSPVPRVGEQDCTGDEASEVCTPLAGADYLIHDPAWRYFSLPAPAAAPSRPTLAQPTVPDPAGQAACAAGAGYDAQACGVYTSALEKYRADQQAYDQAWAQYQTDHAQWQVESETRYEALDQAIATYNNRFAGNKIRDWTQYAVTRTEYETQVAASDPGQILAGGTLRLEGGSLVNDKSQIIAGGALEGDLERLDNIDAEGVHVVHEEGTSQYTYSRWRGGFKRYHQRRWGDRVAYLPADEVTSITLPVTRAEGGTQAQGSGYAPGGQASGGQVDDGSLSAGAAALGERVTQVQAQSGPQTAVEAAREQAAAALAQQAGAAGTGTQTPALVRTVTPGTQLPDSGLYRRQPDPAARYLIETDTRFTDYRQWLSSDYMLAALSSDPARMQKRLGDGFYEQRLIREQVSQLTGRRYLQGHASDEEQYRALMQAGLTYAQQWDLVPGVALTPAQMAQLTTDMVWLVGRDVVLDDGTVQRVLVPQVYVRVQPGDLRGDGTLIAADQIDLALGSDLTNSGTIAGRSTVRIAADNIHNAGNIQGRDILLDARADLALLGGQVLAGEKLTALAGRDLRLESTVRSDANEAGASSFSRTNLDRVAGLYVLNPDAQGTLVASAGRDLTALGGVLSHAGAQGQTQVLAGRDLTLGSVTVAQDENSVADSRNYLRQGSRQDVGSRIETAGDVRLQAGQDVRTVAATISSERGALGVAAGRDIDLQAGRDAQYLDEAHYHKHSGTLGSSSVATRDQLRSDTAQGTRLSAETIVLQAGRDIGIEAGQIAADGDLSLRAGRDVAIEAGQDFHDESHFKETKRSGLMSSGIGFTIGRRQLSTDQDSTQASAAASTVGSVAGDVAIVAGGQYRQTGSDVLAPSGDVLIAAQDIAMTEARDTWRQTQETKFRQSGLSVSVTSPVISAVQMADQMKQAAGHTGDARMQALAAGAAALNAYNNAGAIADSASALANGNPAQAGIGISVTVGSSKSSSWQEMRDDQARGSSVQAGGDVSLVATGAGTESNILLRGSDVTAGGDATLLAQNDIRLEAARNRASQESSSKSSSAGAGVALTFGQNGMAAGVTVSASRGRGSADGRDTTWTNSHVRAGETATLISGADTVLQGAQVVGERVRASVGGDLTIESLQETSTYKGRDSSMGGSMTVGAGFAASGSYSRAKAEGDYASVNEISGIQAGAGGFDVDVAGHTDLRGAVIASAEEAVEEGRNRLSTGTLSATDIVNHSDYKASGISLGGGYSHSSATGKAGDDTVKSGGGREGSVNTVERGQDGAWENFGSGLSGASAGMSKASGSADSVTRSGISGGVLEIRDGAAQTATGQDAETVVAGLDREVLSGDGANGLDKTWDGEQLKGQVQAEAQIVAAFGQQAHQTVETYTQKARETLYERLETASEPERAEIQARLAEVLLEERVLNVLIGAVTGMGGSAVTKEALSAAADEMRKIMIEDSRKFVGVIDGEGNDWNNISGPSVGVRGDEIKLGGTRADLDLLCGKSNERCAVLRDQAGNPVLDGDGKTQLSLKNGMIQFILENENGQPVLFEDFIKTPEGQKMVGATGGIQGLKGTLFGRPYESGSWQDKLIEAFAGTHDYVGGSLSGLYDEQGNAARGRSEAVKLAHEVWSGVAIAPSAPFAAAELLPPDVWQAISILLKAAK